ncbi:hypothetical protein BJ742DRAFT_812149 [Cladochytrium replicatum]|nr:hypothetical protein BJ742DRAFT_812149 [Cladochytrium replicatum]
MATKKDKLLAKLKANEWDTDSWSAYLLECTKTNDVDTTREAYEEILKQFPTLARQWINYIEFEQKNKAYDKVEALFGRCLLYVPSIDLWKCYLNYIRKTHSPANFPPERKAEARATINKAFEFVLNHIGLDKDSASIWIDYIQFIRAKETTTPYEEQRKMDELRRVYQRALVIPLNNIEQLWKDYDNYEMSLNKQLAKKLLAERSPAYMTARTALREMKNLIEPIEKAQKIWMPKPPSWSEKECSVLAMWKRYIAWEKSNPLQFEEKEKPSLIARVVYAYRLALAMLRQYPEVWYDAAAYLSENGKVDDAVAMLKTGIEILPRSLLLNFSLAEIEESRKKDFNDIKPIFDILISGLEHQIIDITAKYDSQRDRYMNAKGVSNDSLEHGEGSGAAVEEEWDGEARELERGKLRVIEKEIEEKVEEHRKRDIDATRKALTLAWIVYMRTARRTQGVKGAREIFKNARKSPNCTYHIFVASALMEYHCSKDSKVAGKLFELGMKSLDLAEDKHAHHYVGHYLDFLVGINDENNARALFERALSAMPAARSRQIWTKFLEFENQYGDLTTFLKNEKRRKEAYPEELGTINEVNDVGERWRYLDISNVGDIELGLADQRRTKAASSTAQRSDERRKSTSDSSRVKYQNLDPVHAERYPRPDLSKWISFQPDAETGTRRAGSPGAKNPTQYVDSSSRSVTQAGGQQQKPGPTVLVPEALARFFASLPQPNTYNGPIIPVNEVMEVLRQTQIPLTNVGPAIVPIALQAEQHGDRFGGDRSYDDPYRGGIDRDRERERERDRRAPRGKGDGRPGPGGAGRGGGAGKRKGRRDSDEEDYGGHRGAPQGFKRYRE